MVFLEFIAFFLTVNCLLLFHRWFGYLTFGSHSPRLRSSSFRFGWIPLFLAPMPCLCLVWFTFGSTTSSSACMHLALDSTRSRFAWLPCIWLIWIAYYDSTTTPLARVTAKAWSRKQRLRNVNWNYEVTDTEVTVSQVQWSFLFSKLPNAVGNTNILILIQRSILKNMDKNFNRKFAFSSWICSSDCVLYYISLLSSCILSTA